MSIGLLRRSEGWRLFACFRSWIGFPFAIGALMLGSMDATDALLTVTHAAGLLLLLCGIRASITRSLAGVILAIGFPAALHTCATAHNVETKTLRAKAVAADALPAKRNIERAA